MNLKIVGAVLIIAGCSGFGFHLAAAHRREESALRQLIAALDFMECELQYRLTPLPELCRQAAANGTGPVCAVFSTLASELEAQVSPDVSLCMNGALLNNKPLPRLANDAMVLLGKSLGRFDLEGQLKGLEAVRQTCRRNLERLGENRDVRLRSYQTLGLCAGAALAILLL